VGSGSAEGFRRVEAILDRFDNTNFTFARGSIAFICGSFALCS
jgi:ribonuclease HI